MNPTWHPDDDLLLAYAAGTLQPAEELLIACHLTLCTPCRAQVAAAEAAAGAYLHADVPPVADLDAALEATLARLGSPPPPAVPTLRDPDGVLPAPLASLLGPSQSLKFTWIFPGVREIRVPVPTEGMPLRLFRLDPGTRVPDHTHRGRELSLVLAGGFTDDAGHFGRGDVCERHGERHRQQVDPGDPCLVLTLADHPLVPYTFRGWLAGALRKV